MSKVLEILQAIKKDHDDTCGTVYPEKPRDNCKYEDLINEAIRKETA